MYEVIINLPATGDTTFTETQPHGVLSVSRLRRAISTSFTIENQSCTVRMNNVSGYWYNLLRSEDRFLTGQKIQIKTGQTLAGTFTIREITPGETEFTITADSFSNLDSFISPALTAATFPLITTQNAGKRGNIIAGVLDDATWLNCGMLTAYLVDSASSKYHAAWHHLYHISQVYDADGQALSFTDENHADQCCYITCPAANAANEIYFNASGLKDDAGSLIENPAHILQKIFDLFLPQIQLTGIDAAAAIYLSRNFTENAILVKDQKVKAFLRLFSQNYQTFMFIDTAGNLKIKAQDWESPIPVATFNAHEIEDFNPGYDAQKVIKSIRRRYLFHYRKDSYLYQPIESRSTGWLASEITIDMCFHRGNAGTFNIATTLLYLSKEPEETVRFQAFQADIHFDLGELIAVTALKGLRTGETRIYLVLRIEGGERKSTVFCIDVLALNKGQIILLDQSDPNVVLLQDESYPHCHVLL